MYKPYETFDVDLREGVLRQEAFAEVLLGSKCEHKHDKKAARTGNLAIEVAQICSDGVKRKSGLYATTAETYAIEFRAKRWVLIPVDDLKEIVENHARKHPESVVWIGDGGNHQNVLLPWAVVLTGDGVMP